MYVKILFGMLAGLSCGVIVMWCGGDGSVINDWIAPFGDIFMRLLKLIAVPLVALSLIKGIGNLGDISSLSKMGFKTLGIYICTTVVAIVVGLALVSTIKPGNMVDSVTSARMASAYHNTVVEKQAAVAQIKEDSPLQAIVDIVPDNIIKASGDNSAMLQIIFAAILVGVSVLLVGEDKSAPFINIVESLNAIVLKIIDIIMSFAPIGVFALMAAMVVSNAGDMGVLGALGMYVVTVVGGLLLMAVVVYPLLVRFLANAPLGQFFKSMWPVQMLAFTTSSSAATLPLTMKQTVGALGVSQRTASFVLPLGVTINMDGTSLYQVVAVVFMAQVLGVDLTLGQMCVIIATTTLSSIGTPGIPGGSIVMLMMVLSSVGLPAEGLALILGLDRPLDMLRTVVNVTGDATVSLIVDKR